TNGLGWSGGVSGPDLARPSPFVLSLSKDAGPALAWFDKLTTNGLGLERRVGTRPRPPLPVRPALVEGRRRRARVVRQAHHERIEGGALGCRDWTWPNPLPFVLSRSKDAGAALAWFDRLTTNGF